MSAKSDREFLELDWIADWREHFRAAQNSSLVNKFIPFEPAHPSFRDEYVLHCPCCDKKVQVLEQQSLIDLQRKFWIAKYVDAQQHSKTQKSPNEIDQDWLSSVESQSSPVASGSFDRLGL